MDDHVIRIPPGFMHLLQTEMDRGEILKEIVQERKELDESEDLVQDVIDQADHISIFWPVWDRAQCRAALVNLAALAVRAVEALSAEEVAG